MYGCNHRIHRAAVLCCYCQRLLGIASANWNMEKMVGLPENVALARFGVSDTHSNYSILHLKQTITEIQQNL